MWKSSDSFSSKELRLEEVWLCIGTVFGSNEFEDSSEVGKGMFSGGVGASDRDGSSL